MSFSIIEKDYKKIRGVKVSEATIIEVAEEAGVSPATVSRVMNDSAPVSSEKESKVMDAVQRLDYKPNKFAHALRKQRSNIVGVVVPDVSNPYFATLIRGAESYLHQTDKSVLICDTNSKAEQEGEYIDTLLEEKVDGVILVSSGEDSKQLESLLNKDIPLVAADRDPHLNKVSKVLANNSEGGKLAADHLIGKGYKSFGLVKGPTGVSTATLREKGFREVLQEKDIAIKQDFLFEGDFTYKRGREAGRKLINRVEESMLPMGIFAADDLMALGVLWELNSAGVQVPEDFGVIGFDDILMSKLMFPSLSTISIPAYQIGQEAAKIVVEDIKRAERDLNITRTEKHFEVKLVERGSTSIT